MNIPTGTPIPNDNPKLESSSSGGVGLVTTFVEVSTVFAVDVSYEEVEVSTVFAVDV